jgi:serine/threonine-protein kinase
MGQEERAELRGAVLEGRYQVGACIGVGGTGVVFEARRITDDSLVVVKTLRPVYAHNPDLVRRLRREAEVARAVGHRGLVPVLDEGTLTDGSPYLVMERLTGESMAHLIGRFGTLGCMETAAIAIHVAAVLHTVHRQGYVHRDLKPEHIWLDRGSRGELIVQLLDFGICASEGAPEDERERERGRVYGTPSYVSPEQACGDPNVDARADVFGLGVTMFEGLTGRLPFRSSNVNQLLRRIIAEDPPRAALVSHHVSPEVDAVVARAMARVPDERFPSMRALARGLAPYAGERPETERKLAGALQVDAGRPDVRPTSRGDVAA